MRVVTLAWSLLFASPLPGCSGRGGGVHARPSGGQDTADTGDTAAPAGSGRRVPAEWEPQEAVWMQWPRWVERSNREDFARVVAAVQAYEPVRLLVEPADREGAEAALAAAGADPGAVEWHEADYDWSWMRDNGPVWVEDGEGLLVEDWGFNAWGVDPVYEQDDAVPCYVAEQEGLRCESWDAIVERGTLEFNGVDTLITSWPCLHDRNPDWSREELERLFREAFGVERVIWLEDYEPDDLTKGHVDGIARFVDEDTVVVPRRVEPGAGGEVYDSAASILEAAGLEVLRMDIPGEVTYRGVPMDAVYVNWLVVDGAVILPGFDVPGWDEAARRAVEGYFPGREGVVVETLELWFHGGGVHCVTNDQPAP